MFKVRFDGGRDLERALLQLTRATARNVVRRALIAAAQPIADAGAANAPRRLGDLADSYGVGTKLTDRQARLHRRRDPVEVFVGPNDPAAVQTEFGNDHQAPEPHLRPAWDAHKMAALDDIQRAMWTELEKAAARAARKAARQAKGRRR